MSSNNNFEPLECLKGVVFLYILSGIELSSNISKPLSKTSEKREKNFNLCLSIKARPCAQPLTWKLFNLHVNKITFSYERMDTNTHFNKKIKGNWKWPVYQYAVPSGMCRLHDFTFLTIPLIFLILESAIVFIFLPGDLRFLDTDRLPLVVFVVFFHVTKMKCCMLRSNFVNL